MPQLRGDLAALGVHCLDDLMPAVQRLTVKAGNTHFVRRRLVIYRSAFSNDEPYIVLGAALVVLQHIVVGNPVGRELARHGRHSNTVFEGKFRASKRGKQNIGVHEAVSR